MSFQSIAELALEELRQKSQKRLYQTDYQAWKSDVLGHRTYEKMIEITDTALFGKIPRTAVKSANGTAKSFEMADMISWAASVFPLGESVSIVSAPSVPQIDKVIFAYLKSNYGLAAARKNQLPGWINESLGWKYHSPGGDAFLAFGRKPPDQDAVSVFQGVRSQFGRTFVFFDEFGGMSRQMFTAAEAVMTGADSRFFGIGNPDNAGTAFQEIYTDPKLADEYNRFTISAFDLPTLTGEVVYPDDPEMEARMLKALTSREWVEHKKRIWGETDARYLSKVLGEFPDGAGNSFFGQKTLDVAYDTTVAEDADVRPIIGVDLARFGDDESVVYVNYGGRVRFYDSWGKTDTTVSAQKVHEIANLLGAAEVRVDSSGIGGAVFDQLERLAQFSDKVYELYGIDGGTRSPDPAQWANNRTYNHDSLRQQMIAGKIDLDYDDTELREQLLGVTYTFNNRGAIQITPKDKMKTVMGGSPDRLDAAIYAAADLSWIIGSAMPGDVISYDMDVFEDLHPFYSAFSNSGW
jgi:hypothetical protein